jgi:RNA polymerase sigma-70 factor, ECF subfamily
MQANFLDRTLEEKALFASVGNLAGADDMALVAVAKDGDRPAFEVLFERYALRILRIAQRVTGNREDAEDVVQQSFQKAFVHLCEFEGRSSFFTWLTRIAVNQALMLRRKSRRSCEVSIAGSVKNERTAHPLEIADSSADPETSYSQRESSCALSSAMDKLPPGIRTAVQLCELDERSVKESAQMMGVSVSAAKSRVLRGRRKLRETLRRCVAPASVFGNKMQINAATNARPKVRTLSTRGGQIGFCAERFDGGTEYIKKDDRRRTQ